MSEKARDPGEPLDPDGIYRQIGLYVVAFQSLQNELMQICWLLTDPPYSDSGRRKMAEESYSWFVREAGRRVFEFLLDQGRERSEFAVSFHACLGCCTEIGKNRNRIVHSAYIHLGELQGIVRSDMKETSGKEVEFDQELLSEQSFSTEMKEIASTAFELAQSRVQLIHWQP
jgi:hypothetical protein